MPITYLGTAKDPSGSVRAGFETSLTVNRKDFGLTWNAALETGGFLVGTKCGSICRSRPLRSRRVKALPRAAIVFLLPVGAP